MSEMVERVAKVIFAFGGGTLPWDRALEADREYSRFAARSVLEAMREPTEAMIEEGGETYSDGFRVGNEMARAVWTSMIGVALASGTHP